MVREESEPLIINILLRVLNEMIIKKTYHCVKSVQIRSYFWSEFSCIQIEYGDLRSKSGSEITTYLDTFHAVYSFHNGTPG